MARFYCLILAFKVTLTLFWDPRWLTDFPIEVLNKLAFP